MRVDSRSWMLAAVLVGALQLAGCGQDVPDMSCDGTVPAFEDVAALKKCVMCHSSALPEATRRGAPESVNFDTESAASARADQASTEVNGGIMPPPSSGITLTDEEKQTLYKWALCH
jgi:uncharacterized membrane protein